MKWVLLITAYLIHPVQGDLMLSSETKFDSEAACNMQAEKVRPVLDDVIKKILPKGTTHEFKDAKVECVLDDAGEPVLIDDGHDANHDGFYSKLIRRDTKTSCCNETDCRPTSSRMIDDHYEVVVEGNWLRVPPIAIQQVAAPDGGTHVCAPKQEGKNIGVIYCVVLPPEI